MTAIKADHALINDRLRLAYLAPDIVEMITEGRQPKAVAVGSHKRTCPLPVAWEEQRRLLLDLKAG